MIFCSQKDFHSTKIQSWKRLCVTLGFVCGLSFGSGICGPGNWDSSESFSLPGAAVCQAATTWSDGQTRTDATITDGLNITSSTENTIGGAVTVSGTAGEGSTIQLMGAGALTILSGGSVNATGGFNVYGGATINVNSGATFNFTQVSGSGSKIRLARTAKTSATATDTTVNWAGTGLWDLGCNGDAIFMSAVNQPSDTTAHSIFNITGGSFEIRGGNTNLAFAGTTDWNISGGTFTAGTGTVNGTNPTTLSFGGGMWASAPTVNGNINLFGTGTMAIRGAGNMIWGSNSGSTSTANLKMTLSSGGTLSTSRSFTKGSVPTINASLLLDGGTFEAVKPASVTGNVALNVETGIASTLGTHGATFNVAEGVTLNFADTMQWDGTGNRTITKNGDGRLVVNIANAADSGTLTLNLNAGTFAMTAQKLKCQQSDSNRAKINISNGATFEYDAGGTVWANLTMDAGSYISSTQFFTLRGQIAGDMTVGAGQVELGAEARLASAPLNSLTVNSGASIYLWYDDRLGKTDGTLNLNGGNYVVQSSHIINANRTFNVSGSSSIETPENKTLTLDCKIHANAGATLSKKDVGTLILNNDNSSSLLSGSTLALTAGTLQISNQNQLGSAKLNLCGGTLAPTTSLTLTNSLDVTVDSTVQIADGQTLALAGNLVVTNAKLLTSGTGTLELAPGVSFGGSVDISLSTTSLRATTDATFGRITIAQDSNNQFYSPTVEVAANKTLTLWSGFANWNNASFHKTGAGTLVIGDGSNSTGATTVDVFVDEGVFALKREETLTNNKTIHVADGATFRYLASSEGTSAAKIEITGGGTGILDVADGRIWNCSGVISSTDDSTVKKIGTGTLVITSATANPVDFLINEGTVELAVNGGANAVNDVTLATGGTLKITSDQQIGGTLTLSGGTLNAAEGKMLSVDTLEVSSGTMTSLKGISSSNIVVNSGSSISPLGTDTGTQEVAGNLSMDAGTTLQIQITSPTTLDKMDVNGIADLDSNSKIEISLADGLDPYSLSWLEILSAGEIQIDGAKADTNVDWSSILNDSTGSLIIAMNSDATALFVTANPNMVPEPASWILGVLGILGIFGIGRLGVVPGFRRRSATVTSNQK